MKTAPADLRGCGPFAEATPAEVRAALIDESAAEFDRHWRETMVSATESLDLAAVNEMLDGWRRLAWVQQDRAAYAHMMDVAAKLNAGEHVDTVPWEQVRAELGI
jgi:hypothetical protein